MRFKHCTYVELPFDVEPRRITTLVELPITPTEPSGVRVKIRRFKLFGKLPDELQFMIWTLTAKSSRCITVKRLVTSNIVNDPAWCSSYLRAVVSAGASVPPVLHTTYSSRQAGLKIYKLSFAKLLQAGGIYFNFSLDSLYFPSSDDCKVFLGQRHLADNPRSASHHISPQVCQRPLKADRDEVTQNLRRLVVGYWKCNSDVNKPSLTLDMFVSLESFVTGYRSLRAFSDLDVAHAARNYGGNWSSLVHKPEVEFKLQSVIHRMTKPTVVKRKKTTGQQEKVAGTAENPFVID